MGDFSELKNKLTERQRVLSDQLERLKKDVSKPHTSDWSEQAQERENDEVLNQLGSSVEAELREVNSALDRMKDDRYGICISCHTGIPVARLNIKPEVSQCIDCAD